MEFFIGLTISNFLYIVVLLILAGISIGQLTGNGLFEKVKEAREITKNAEMKENEILSNYENIILEKSYRELNNESKSIMTAILNTKQTTTSNIEKINFNEVYSSIGSGFELANGNIQIKGDISYIKVSVQIYCTEGFTVNEVPSIRLLKNGENLVSSASRMPGTHVPLFIQNFLLSVNKDDIINIELKANSSNRTILGDKNPSYTFITLEEV